MSNSLLLLQNLRAQQATQASQVAADISKYGSANPKLGDDKAGLDSINSQIKSEVSRIGQRAANDYKAAQMTEDNTREVYEQTRKAADVQSNKAIAVLIARQEATDARSLYQTLYSHLKEAGVMEGLRSSNVAVVDPGRVPSKPIPYILIIPALALVLGGFFGIAGALLVESTSDRIEAMETIESSLRAPILAVLPMTQDPLFRRHRFEVSPETRQRQPGFRGWKGSGSRRSEHCICGSNTRTPHFIAANPKGPPPKTILITSAGEREGKSTLSLNLAAALVLNGSRVLLVDGDMRSSGLSGYMGFGRKEGVSAGHQKSGLSDALSGPGEAAVITPFSELPNLSALPAGLDPRYPAELLGSERMQALVGRWSASYDYVLIDSPPVLAVADAVILSRLADHDSSRGQAWAKHTKESGPCIPHTAQVEGRNIGIVVNGVRRDSVSFDEFYGYKGTSYYSEA